jgi:hypothetical protein
MRAPLATGVAIVVGLIILFGYFIPYPPLQNGRALLLSWAVTLAGVALLVGVANLVGTHWRKLVGARRERDFYSLFLILAFFITFITGIFLTPSSTLFQKAVTAVQAPVETSLMALLSVTLAYACLRLFQKRRALSSFFFIISVFVFLLLGSGLLYFLGNASFLRNSIGLMQQIPLAGGRGILLGIALGTITAGLRILFGSDRPYRG